MKWSGDTTVFCHPTERGERDTTSISDREMQEIEAANASAQRMYQLIRQPGPIGDRRFEIEFLDVAVQEFVCAFG